MYLWKIGTLLLIITLLVPNVNYDLDAVSAETVITPDSTEENITEVTSDSILLSWNSELIDESIRYSIYDNGEEKAS